MSVETARLVDVNARLDVAQRGIESITGQSSRATTVFSNAKYPAPKLLPNYARLHVGAHALELPKPYADAQVDRHSTDLRTGRCGRGGGALEPRRSRQGRSVNE